MSDAGGTVRSRRALLPDASALAEIAGQAYRHYLARMDRPPAPLQTDYAAAIQQDEVWLAENDRQIVGLLILELQPTALQIENVAVRPSAQHHGIGRQLLALAERRVRELGHRRLTLCTNELMTENLQLYRALGYQEVARSEQDGYRRVFLAKTLT